MRPDYCPVGGEPCQSVRIEPCSTKRGRVSYVCPICAASMIESDEALLRQALKALERGAWDTLSGRNAAAAIRERLGEKA